MNTIDPNIREDIIQRLDGIERDNDVRIVYACESGSRAWGFESQDSDYDVRFIYVRPRAWYLSVDLERKRDVIEVPINEVLDISGWDIRKALQLFHKSNPPLYEWLISPIVYREIGHAADRLRELAPVAYNPIAARYHYLRMAQNTIRAYLSGDTVRRKKYFYALRPLLAVCWIEREMGVVPTEFDKLVGGVVSDEGLLSEISKLLEIKRAGSESDEGPRLPIVHAFIVSEIGRHGEDAKQNPGTGVDFAALNDIFRETVECDAPN